MKKSCFINQHECNKIYSKGKIFFTNFLIIKTVNQKKNFFRVGIAVPKKVFKHAYIRNKIRRQLKSIIEITNFKLGDHLIIVKKNYNWKKDYQKLIKDIINFIGV